MGRYRICDRTRKNPDVTVYASSPKDAMTRFMRSHKIAGTPIRSHLQKEDNDPVFHSRFTGWEIGGSSFHYNVKGYRYDPKRGIEVPLTK